MIAGFDEAGRGSLIGPLVTSLVIFDKKVSFEGELRDSKKISRKKREELFERIREEATVFFKKIKPGEIDRYSLNKLERKALLELVEKAGISKGKLYVDKFGEVPKSIGNIKVIAEHKADDKYRVVSAASIVAKVIRDREIEKIKEKVGDFGSGYPSDRKTREFVKRNFYDIEPYIRKKWKSVERILTNSIEDYF